MCQSLPRHSADPNWSPPRSALPQRIACCVDNTHFLALPSAVRLSRCGIRCWDGKRLASASPMEAPTRRESLAVEASRPSLDESRVSNLLTQAGVPTLGNWASPKREVGSRGVDGLTSAASVPSLGTPKPALRSEASELPRTASRVRAAAAAMESSASTLSPQGAASTPQQPGNSGSRVRATSAHLQALVSKPAPWGVAKGLPSDETPPPPPAARPSDAAAPESPGFRVSAAAAVDVPLPSALGGESARPRPSGTGAPADGAQLRLLFAAVAVVTGALVAAKSRSSEETHSERASSPQSLHSGVEALSDAQVLAIVHRAERCTAAMASHEEGQALLAPTFLCPDPDGGRLPAELRAKLFGANPPVVRDAHVPAALATRASAAAARRKERLAAPMVVPARRVHVATA